MHILINGVWKDRYLDQALLENTVRIKSLAWFNIEKINELYFIPSKSWRLIFNYVREIGVKAVFRKIISRLQESARNEKYLSFGVGIVIETKSKLFNKNDAVIFSALCHPQCMERIVLVESLVDHCEDPWIDEMLDSREVLFAKTFPLERSIVKPFFQYRGWSEYSGIRIPYDFKKNFQSIFNAVKQTLDCINFTKLPLSLPSLPKERYIKTPPPGTTLKAELYGYGQYAKTIILPSVKKLVHISCIHEIDPTQLPVKKNKKIIYDSSPEMRIGEEGDLCFIASYHHTHASLAIEALKRNKAAIIEKPIVTTLNDLKNMLEAMKKSHAPLFSCFHKRYLFFNQFIYRDLGILYADPISFHCVVFEVPLPKLHWYQWPNSGSRLLSNGCHWIDYFLFLNNFIPVSRYSVQVAKNGPMNVFVELENTAVFTMTLTELGSSRTGLREHIELRAGKSTIIITDGCQYDAENQYRVLRKIKLKRLSVYRRMYKEIVQRILQKKSGDSIESVERSSSLILSLEKCYQSTYNHFSDSFSSSRNILF